MQSVLTPGRKACDVSESTPNLQYAYGLRTPQETGKETPLAVTSRLPDCGRAVSSHRVAVGRCRNRRHSGRATSPPTPKSQNIPTLAQERDGEATAGLHRCGGYLTKISWFLGRCTLSRISDPLQTSQRNTHEETGAVQGRSQERREPGRANQSDQQAQKRNTDPDIPPRGAGT